MKTWKSRKNIFLELILIKLLVTDFPQKPTVSQV